MRHDPWAEEGRIHRGQVPPLAQKFRTTVWKNTGVRRFEAMYSTSPFDRTRQARSRSPSSFRLISATSSSSSKSAWSTTGRPAANGGTWWSRQSQQPKPAPGTNIVSVDLGEIHPAVVGDETTATIITCRARRAESQGHAKRLAKLQAAIAGAKKGSRRYRRLVKAKSRMKAKHEQVMYADMEHKISRAASWTWLLSSSHAPLRSATCRDIAGGPTVARFTMDGRSRVESRGKIGSSLNTRPRPKESKLTLVNEHHTTPDLSSLRSSPQTEGGGTITARLAGFRHSRDHCRTRLISSRGSRRAMSGVFRHPRSSSIVALSKGSCVDAAGTSRGAIPVASGAIPGNLG